MVYITLVIQYMYLVEGSGQSVVEAWILNSTCPKEVFFNPLLITGVPYTPATLTPFAPISLTVATTIVPTLTMGISQLQLK